MPRKAPSMPGSCVQLHILGALLLAALGAGCTRTVGGGSEESPDGKYRIYGRIQGAAGRRFVDSTSKQIFIKITKVGNPETLLYAREIRTNASDLTFHAVWQTNGGLVLTFFDYGPGVSAANASRTGAPSNHILTASYSFDAKRGQFVESP